MKASRAFLEKELRIRTAELKSAQQKQINLLDEHHKKMVTRDSIERELREHLEMLRSQLEVARRSKELLHTQLVSSKKEAQRLDDMVVELLSDRPWWRMTIKELFCG
jgi:hypothetical protein